MRRLAIKDAEVMALAIHGEIQRSEEARYDHRLHGMLLLCNGMSCYDVARVLGHSPRTVEGWVKRFESGGLAGLREQERPGRPASLDETALKQVGTDLRQRPSAFGYKQGLWDGKLLSHHLRHRYGLALGVRQCQRLFGKLGFRRRKPRPVIAKADPSAQRAFKKTSSADAKRSR